MGLLSSLNIVQEQFCVVVKSVCVPKQMMQAFGRCDRKWSLRPRYERPAYATGARVARCGLPIIYSRAWSLLHLSYVWRPSSGIHGQVSLYALTAASPSAGARSEPCYLGPALAATGIHDCGRFQHICSDALLEHTIWTFVVSFVSFHFPCRLLTSSALSTNSGVSPSLLPFLVPRLHASPSQQPHRSQDEQVNHHLILARISLETCREDILLFIGALTYR